MSEERLFGMPAEKGRWMFVVLGFIINICLGSVYAYSVFRGPVAKLLNMSATEAGLPFMVFLALFAIMVFFGGLLLAKLGPKMLGWLGGIVYFAIVALTMALGLAHIARATPWRPLYIVAYAALAGNVVEGIVIDTDHWRHYFLMLGIIWGLVAASRNLTAARAVACPDRCCIARGAKFRLADGCACFSTWRRSWRRALLPTRRAECRSELPDGSARQAGWAKAPASAIARWTMPASRRRPAISAAPLRRTICRARSRLAR